jgi:glycosyltransferase involved in cell wall biosynthesis
VIKAELLKKRILIITYYWPPAGGPGVQRWLKFAGYLPEFSIDPVILTVDPDTASYQVRDDSLLHEADLIRTFRTKTYEPFKLFSKVTGEKKIPVGGLEQKNKKRFFGTVSHFIRGNLFIPDPRRGWNFKAYKKARQLIKEFEIDTIVTTSPPHSTQLIGLKLKKKLKIRWIADLRDPWTDIYYYRQFMHTPIAKAIDNKYERRVLEMADHIIVVSEGMRKGFLPKTGRDIGKKFSVIPNGYDQEDFQTKEAVTADKYFNIVYTGTITSLYGINVLVDALSDLKSKFPHIRLKLVGTADKDIRNLIHQKHLESITEFIPYVVHSKLPVHLKGASVLLLCIPDMKKNEGIITGKLFEYLAARKPILCIGPVRGDAAAIIFENEAGKVFDYNDKKGITDYILSLINKQFTINHQNTKYLNYSRKNLTGELVKIIQEMQ